MKGEEFPRISLIQERYKCENNLLCCDVVLIGTVLSNNVGLNFWDSTMAFSFQEDENNVHEYV